MSLSLIRACVLAAACIAPLAANPGTGTLTLVTGQTGMNKLSITVSATASGFTVTDTQTTTVTGSINGSIDADPGTGASTAMTITGGDIAMTGMHFILKTKVVFIWVTVADITTANMGGTCYTPPPVPAPVTANASGGTFDAALHHVVINRGTMTGSVTIPGSPATPVDENFAASPVDGAGTGIGTITMVPGAADATHRTFQATVQIPVDFTQTQDLSGTPVTIGVKGTIKAAGPVKIPLDSLPTPAISPAAGKYPTGQAITITGQTGSTIFYRLNGGAEQSAPSPVTNLTVPVYPATLTVSAYARQTGAADSATITTSYSSAKPFESWTSASFPGVSNPAITGLTADPDRDGQSNLLEFALGGNPNRSDDGPKITSLTNDGTATRKFLLTIAVRAGAPPFTGSPSPTATVDGVSYTVLGGASPNQADGQVSAVVPPQVTGLPAAPTGYQYRTFKLDAADGLAGSGFLRVKVTAVP